MTQFPWTEAERSGQLETNRIHVVRTWILQRSLIGLGWGSSWFELVKTSRSGLVLIGQRWGAITVERSGGTSCQKQCPGASSVLILQMALRHEKGQSCSKHKRLAHPPYYFSVLASHTVFFSILYHKLFDISKKFYSFDLDCWLPVLRYLINIQK